MKVWRQEDWADLSSGIDEIAQSEDMKQNVQTLADIVPSKEAKAACEKAVYYLQFSGKTESELRKKLAEQEFSPASVDYAVAFVKKCHYIDDEEYTRRYVERNGSRKSRKQMIFELIGKGVSRDIIDKTFENMAVDEESQILMHLKKKKFAGEEATREEKQKISAYLVRKGFAYDAIRSAMNRYE